MTPVTPSGFQNVDSRRVPPFLSPLPRVRLVDAFARPFDGVVAAARTCYSPKGIVTVDDVAGDPLADPAERARRRERRDALARDVYAAGHHTTFQHAHLQFTLENVSRQLVWSFLHAHPHYNSEQTSQRYVEVKPGRYAVPALAGEALEVYRACCEMQTEAYRRLGDALAPRAARAFFATFRGRASQPERWEKAIRKRALEVARYALPVATFTTLYHTVPAVTLLRYRRLAATFDAPTEQRLVVEAMTDELLRHDPSWAAVLQEPIPLEETPEHALAERLFSAPRRDRPGDGSFRSRFDASLDGRVSKLVDRKARNEGLLAEAVREVVGVTPEALSDDDAIALAVDPAANRLLGESLNLTEHGKLSRALHHPAYTFRKKLSHTADSQDQRHRTTPGSRPTLHAYLSDEPDYVTPMLLEEPGEARTIYDETMARTWEAIARLGALGVPDEWRAYLLPNAVALRFTESADLAGLKHKLAMRLCWNAQEEIWRASVDEAEQVRDAEPRIGRWLLPPCGLRARAGAKPVCPEGERFCGVLVWKQDLTAWRRLL
ncbi:MAG TPA: FAD-dependent thymidylate synthase [Thermoanaerobaculia bacterium]|nr:FAD-dependent thymidylate synthase [Thermoanaerobaculia bacterium]